jgi:ankyrin repeat protein
MAERIVITADDFKDADSIKNMITNKCGGNVNGNDAEGYTPLCAAILLGISQEILIDFIKNPEINDNGDRKYYKGKIDPNKKCNKGKTPLQIVCMSMNTAALDVLMGAAVEVPKFITNPYNTSEQIPQYKLDPDTHEYTTEQDTVEISVNPSYYYNNEDIKVEARDVMSASILPKPEIFQKLIDKFENLFLNYKSLIDKDLNNPLHLACIVSCYGIIDALESAIINSILKLVQAVEIIIDNVINAIKDRVDAISNDTIKEAINAVIADIVVLGDNYRDSAKKTLEEKLNITFSEDDTILTTIDEIKTEILTHNIPIINKTPVKLIDLIMTFFVNAPNKDGKTPFMIALENGDDGLIAKLAKYLSTAAIQLLVETFVIAPISMLKEAYENIFDYLLKELTWPGGSKLTILGYIKINMSSLFTTLQSKIYDYIQERLTSDPSFVSEFIKSSYGKIYSSSQVNIISKSVFDKIASLSDESIKSLDKEIQPIIGKLQYVPSNNTVLFYNINNNQRTVIPNSAYEINNCAVTWKNIPSSLNGKRCYFSAT